MLRLAKEREELAVINDQFGAPTGAELLADCTAHAIRVAQNKPEVAGLYPSGCQRYHNTVRLCRVGFEEARKAGLTLLLTNSMLCQQQSIPHQLVVLSILALTQKKFQQNFELVLPDWQVGAKRMLNELYNNSNLIILHLAHDGGAR